MTDDTIRLLSDEQLLHDIENAATHERGATAQFIALLAEMDGRRLYLQQGYSSMFVYCTGCLHLSEHAAYGRIEAARAARKCPIVLERLADGSITLTTICLLSNHLTADNCQTLLAAATHKSRRDVEKQVAAIRPSADAPPAVRKLPNVRPSGVLAAPTEESGQANENIPTIPKDVRAANERPPGPQPIRPLAPERYKVQFTIGPESHRKLRAVQDLMRHRIPNGDLAEIFDRAITLLLRDVERRRLCAVERPRATKIHPVLTGRYIPASTKREVWARDQGQCAFVGAKGRCAERGCLEFHHVIPFAEGGETSAKNLELRCRAHNAHEARQHVGSELVPNSVIFEPGYGLEPG